jgi:hypothetical protein
VLTLATASAVVCLGAPTSAHACGTTLLVAHPILANPVDVTPPTLTVGEVVARRGWLDNRGYRCQEAGDIAIAVDATDDVSAPATIGYTLDLVSGALPAGATMPDVQRVSYADGAIHVSWYERSAAAFEVCFAVSAVDEAGNVSAPTTACADGAPIDEGTGCAIAAPQSRTRSLAVPLSSTVAVAGVLLARRRRRVRLLRSPRAR